MDYLAAFGISASGMAVEKTRLDIVALNLANVSTTKGVDGGPYRPLRVITGVAASSPFEQHMAGAKVVDVQPMNVEPRQVYEPHHPHADARGFVAYPNINPISEMVVLIEATRAYEANVRALNAAVPSARPEARFHASEALFLRLTEPKLPPTIPIATEGVAFWGPQPV